MLGRSIRAVLWLGPAALLWAVLAFVARVANVEGAAITNILFVLALPLTYVAGVGAVVHASDQPRRAVMRVAALTLGIIAALTLLEMAAAVRLVHAGEAYIPPMMLARLLPRLGQSERGLGNDLTPREREILGLLARGREGLERVLGLFGNWDSSCC